ncbi:hypothetical protein BDZ45DRAFT_560387, partial [Acephala macrosclerotiorum]
MPRGPTTSKRQQGAANHRDTRHENGLVGPGKRIQKQKSNGHLNGHAKSPDSNSSTPPLPGTPPPTTNGYARHSIPGDHTTDPKMVGEALRRSSVSASSDSSAFDIYQNPSGSAATMENHRQIDVSAVKNPSVHRDSINLILTVLQSCPLRDTLAILIVLLQIPPTFLSIVHLLFATLTFVPPSTSAQSSLSYTDILQGTLGTPSVGTIFLIDMVVLLVWLFLWSPLQDIALDLAQTVIALTLGGGTSGKEAGTKNVLWCFGVIWVSHIVRNGNVKQGGLRAIIGSNLGSPDPDDPLEPSSLNGNKRHGLIRSILAIHILTQGVVRYIRDWYVRRERRDHTASIGDPEAGKPTADVSDSTMTAGAETDTSSSLALGTAATLKKKKKHSAQVRIRQPLWAALASTKIVMVKEYETSHTAAESAGTNATDMNNLGNAPFNAEADRIWITYVGSDEVYFSTSFFPIHTPQPAEERRSEGVDRTKPFYVRVNRTIWQPTRINVINDPASPSGQEMRWNGEIFGLAPTSNYQCDFHSSVDDSVIFSTSVRTLQSLTTDLGVPPNPQITGRPGSPITTLKTSIATADLKLTEERNRQKREKRDQQKKLGSLKKEIDRLTSGIASTGGNDDKLKQKAQQSQLHMKQAEDATAALETQIESFEAVPTDDTSLYADSKGKIQSERDQHKKLLNEFNAAKQKAERHLANLKAELTSIQQKCESKQARVSQLNTKHESLTDANAKGLDEVQRKESERQAKQHRREQILAFYNERHQAKLTEVNEGETALQALDQAMEAVQQHIAEKEVYLQSPSPSNQNLSIGFASPYAPMMSLAGPSNSPHGSRTRGRSSSMLSNVSGFTQSDDGN